MKRNSNLFLMVALFATTLGCSTPYNHQVMGVNLRPQGPRVEIKEKGAPRVFGYFATGEDPNVYQVLNDMRELNACKTLKNIQLNHYVRHYLLWSNVWLHAQADCVN